VHQSWGGQEHCGGPTAHKKERVTITCPHTPTMSSTTQEILATPPCTAFYVRILSGLWSFLQFLRVHTFLDTFPDPTYNHPFYSLCSISPPTVSRCTNLKCLHASQKHIRRPPSSQLDSQSVVTQYL